MKEDPSRDLRPEFSSVLRDSSPSLERMVDDSDAAPVVHDVAETMFKTLNTRPKEEFAQEACELNPISQGDDAKTINKSIHRYGQLRAPLGTVYWTPPTPKPKFKLP